MDAIERRTRASKLLMTLAAFVVVVAGMSAAKVILVPILLTITVKIALDSRDDTRWLAVLLGPAMPAADVHLNETKSDDLG